MPLHLTDVDHEYNKNQDLQKTDVEAVINWIRKQQHLPQITELQAILFLQSCNYSNEAAKNAIDTYFTMKTLHPDIFREKNPSLPSINSTIKTSLATTLPRKTPEGYTIVFLKLINTNTEHFHFIDHIKIFIMACLLQLYQEGTSEGHLIVADMDGAAFGHLTKVAIAGPSVIKKFLHYLQEAMPIKLKGLHFVNIVPFMDKVLAMVKPFMKMELLDMVYLHHSVNDLVKVVPLECLPADYGGTLESISLLHERAKEQYLSNTEFFQWEDEQITDENKRIGKPRKKTSGIEGTFKKLNID